MKQYWQLIRLAPLVNPIRLKGCDALIPILKEVMRDWDIEICQPADLPPPLIEIRHTAKGYRRTSPWLDKPEVLADPLDAACDLIVDLVNAYVADREGMLCLHSAAVEFSRGLVVFPNSYHGGKSTLVGRLAMTGARIYSDDVLPVSQNPLTGIALGIQPRLRIPLPQSASNAYRQFIADQAGPGNHHWQHIALKESQQARLGQVAPIQAIVVLQRGEDEPAAELLVADKGKILEDVVRRNFARQNPALEILNSLYAIVEQAQCYNLRYSDLEQATELLEQAFGSTEMEQQHASKQFNTAV